MPPQSPLRSPHSTPYHPPVRPRTRHTPNLRQRLLADPAVILLLEQLCHRAACWHRCRRHAERVRAKPLECP
eukprot:358110-Chlamydomonas_euryale.AAC.4